MHEWFGLASKRRAEAGHCCRLRDRGLQPRQRSTARSRASTSYWGVSTTGRRAHSTKEPRGPYVGIVRPFRWMLGDRRRRIVQNVEQPELRADPGDGGRPASRGGERRVRFASEVIREALRLWQAHQAAREHEVEEFRRIWREGLERAGHAPRFRRVKAKVGVCSPGSGSARAREWRATRSGPKQRLICLRSGCTLRRIALERPIACSTGSRSDAAARGQPPPRAGAPEIAPDARAWIVGRYLILYRVPR